MQNFSPSCERNQQVIFETLLPWLQQTSSVLEIGSGSGQHAFHFCEQLAHLSWQCSDQGEYYAGLLANIAQSNNPQINQAIELDVNGRWPTQSYDMIYTSNSLHIMSWQSVKALFSQLSAHLKQDGYFCCYGPFKYQGEFTSPSNADFEQWLINRNSQSGIRDFEALCELATEQQLTFVSDIAMPANNQLLIWQKA